MEEIKTVISKDVKGHDITEIWVDNGLIRFSILPDRGMDIGEVYMGHEKISWDRGRERLLHPDSVNIKDVGAWEMGFFSAVANLGPEVFGTPDEVRTVHGTGSYSPFDVSSLFMKKIADEITVTCQGFVKGYGSKPQYKKTVTIKTYKNTGIIWINQNTENLTDEVLHIDDGYHIQMAGEYMKNGGRYVLPNFDRDLLLRDSVPSESEKKAIYPFDEYLDPIRCYQYVPNVVANIKESGAFKEIFSDGNLLTKESKNVIKNMSCNDTLLDNKLTAEMLVNKTKDTGVIFMRNIDEFSRSLLAKRHIKGDEVMYAIEVVKTRPNSIKQKAIDGELMYIKPQESFSSNLFIEVTKNKRTIQNMATLIESQYM